MPGAMMVPPTAFGNAADEEWPPPPRGPPRPGVGGPGPGPGGPPAMVVVQAVEAYPSPLPRKCVWAMLLLSCILVLRVQQDRYADVPRWNGGGVPDSGMPFPWEAQALVSQNDTYEATFLSPIIRRASTFMSSQSAPTVIAGLPRLVVAGDGDKQSNGAAALPTATAGVVAISGSFKLAPPACSSQGDAACFLGVQRFVPPPSASSLMDDIDRQMPSQLVSCHRFVAGASAKALQPLSPKVGGNGSSVLCVGSKRIHSLAPTAAADDSAVVAWEPVITKMRVSSPPLIGRSSDQGPRSPRMVTCLAVVSLNGGALQVGSVAAVETAITVLYDQGSKSLVTVGFSGASLLSVNQYDSVTLEHKMKYRLPLSVAWLLRAPRLADGYLLFVGSEEPFTGSIFTIDLARAEVYEQDPPVAAGSGRMPKRKKLPRSMVAETVEHSRPKSSWSSMLDSLCSTEVVPDPMSSKASAEAHSDVAPADHLKGEAGASDAAAVGLDGKRPGGSG